MHGKGQESSEANCLIITKGIFVMFLLLQQYDLGFLFGFSMARVKLDILILDDRFGSILPISFLSFSPEKKVLKAAFFFVNLACFYIHENGNKIL